MQPKATSDQFRLLAEARACADVEPQTSASHLVDTSTPTPFYHLVPKDIAANLRFRRAVLGLAAESAENKRELWIMCSRDILFWVNTFVWTFDPGQDRNLMPGDRPEIDYPALPLVTWAFQDDAILAIDAAVGHHDLVIKKSRDMGATWNILVTFAHRFIFRDLQTFLCLSKNEDAVDKADDPDSLFSKLDFIFDGENGEGGLPGWMRPQIDRKFKHFGNEENGSCIDGGSTASDAGRGGRRTASMLDEFATVPDGYGMLAATRDSTPSRIINSTPKGTGNAFYDVAHNPKIKQLTLHWTQHPNKSKGQYRDGNGKPRSPWYDYQCERAANPQEIAQELDIDFLGSDFQFFHGPIICEVQNRTVCQPFFTGDFEYDPLSGQPRGASKRPGGPLLLWLSLDMDGQPPDDCAYAMAADISQGVGASNSVVAIGNRQTREKVGEFVTNQLNPADFAVAVYALGHWFAHAGRPAYLIWEDNGPGSQFRTQILRMGYTNYFFRRDENRISGVITDTPGYYTAPGAGKQRLLGEYRRALAQGDFINRSFEALEECKQYVFTRGELKHSRAAATRNLSDVNDNHGDRVIADALLWKVLSEGQIVSKRVDEKPQDSFWGRQQAYRSTLRNRKVERWSTR